MADRMTATQHVVRAQWHLAQALRELEASEPDNVAAHDAIDELWNRVEDVVQTVEGEAVADDASEGGEP